MYRRYWLKYNIILIMRHTIFSFLAKKVSSFFQKIFKRSSYASSSSSSDNELSQERFSEHLQGVNFAFTVAIQPSICVYLWLYPSSDTGKKSDAFSSLLALLNQKGIPYKILQSQQGQMPIYSSPFSSISSQLNDVATLSFPPHFFNLN